VGAKLDFLRRAIASGHDVQVHFIGISDARLSEVRVMQQVEQGGHDIPSDSPAANLQLARQRLHGYT
jgi:predicted ABC-type ATPase